MGIIVVLIDLTTFKASLEQLRHHRHRRVPKIGRRGAHLLFGSNLAQFRGL